MIRVISISTDKKVFEEGSAVHARLLKQRELFEELHVIVFTSRFSGLSAKQVGNLWIYPTNSLSRWLYIRDALSLARGLIAQRDMTNTNTVITAQDPFECGLVAVLAAKGNGIPIQIQIHTDFLSPEFARLSLLNKIRVRIARRLLPRASGIRVVSKRIEDSLEANDIRIQAPIDVLPVFSAHALEWALKPLRRFKHEEDTGCLVLSISRLSPEKDISLGLRALERLLDEGEAIGLVIVGEGNEEFRIRDEVAIRGLERNVRLELWQSNTASFHRVANILLLTSRFEGFGLVLLEAAVHAQPIVTTDVGIARELIPQEYERFICPVGDEVCVAAGLRELAQDSALRLKYGSALRASAKKFVVPETEYWKAYRELIERCLTPVNSKSFAQL